jgi:hypothetical protein
MSIQRHIKNDMSSFGHIKKYIKPELGTKKTTAKAVSGFSGGFSVQKRL